MALVFAAQVGKGKIIICGSNLLEKSKVRPAAKQFLYSLEKYFENDFHAKHIQIEELENLFNEGD